MTASDGEKARVYVKTSEVALGATRNGEQSKEKEEEEEEEEEGERERR